MKRCLGLLLLLIMSMSFWASCDNDKNGIISAAYGYCMATSQYDFEEAEQYCTMETQNTTLLVAKDVMSMLDTGYVTKDSPVSIEILSTVEKSDTLALAIYHKITPIKDFTDTLELRKRNGKWLVHSPIIKNNADVQ